MEEVNCMENEKINVNYSDVILKSFKFEKSENYKEQPYKIDFEDFVKISCVTEESFKIEFSRSTRHSDPFVISATFELTVSFDKNGIEYFNGNLEQIREFAAKKKIEIVNGVAIPARASLLIGNVVREFGAPLITPPFTKINF